MREIKFKVWNKNENYMSDSMSVQEISSNPNGVAPNIIWFQYTGLKDKNGKEIYEGDIVQYGKTKEKFIIKWEEIDAGGYIGGIGFYDYPDCKVIGNIYQNPELLK